ncbi:MAG: response regulator [Terriglobia bacterium]
METLRILLADDHPVVIKGLRSLLENQPGWQVCGEACDGQEAVSKASELKPDVVVLDVSMPRLNGLEAARRIHSDLAGTEVLVLTVHESEEMVREALRAGVRGYLLKSDPSSELLDAIRTLSQHKPFLSHRISQKLGAAGPFSSSGRSRKLLPDDPLSPRERQIAQLLAEGKSTKDVASDLGISFKTAETHRANIMRKLDIHSTSELVRYAIRNNLVQP